jgi:preprotein translocase subunit SecG
MQRSEGGGLGVGGNSSGLMTARGAADFLTRATTILATIFVLLSILLAALAAQQGGPREIDPSLLKTAPTAPAPAAPVPGAPALPGQAPAGPLVPQNGSAVPGAAPAVRTPAPETRAPGNTQGGVPIAQ